MTLYLLDILWKKVLLYKEAAQYILKSLFLRISNSDCTTETWKLYLIQTIKAIRLSRLLHPNCYIIHSILAMLLSFCLTLFNNALK